MNGTLTLIIVGLVIYFLFSKKGSIGCCGGHANHHTPQQTKPPLDGEFSNQKKAATIDLGKDDYAVVSVEKKKQI